MSFKVFPHSNYSVKCRIVSMLKYFKSIISLCVALKSCSFLHPAWHLSNLTGTELGKGLGIAATVIPPATQHLHFSGQSSITV